MPQRLAPKAAEITLNEYNRRWTMIMQAYEAGFLTHTEAMDAIRELTSMRIRR